MKKGWEVKKLGEIVSFRRGLTYSKNDEAEFSSNVVLRANNINLTTNTLDLNELKYIDDRINIPSEKKLPKDSLIICTASGSKSHLGKVAFIENDYNYAFGGFMGRITAIDNIDPKYLFYNLTSESYKNFISNLSDGVNINNLKFDDLKMYSLLVPQLPEQQRIVAILDEAFAAIEKVKENAEKNLNNARELFDSYLQSVFASPGEGWEEKKLGVVCDFVRGPFGGSLKKQLFVNEGFAVYEQSHAIYNQFKDVRYYVNQDKFNEMKRFEIKPGNLIMSCSGTMGKIAIVPEGIEKGIINQALLLLIPTNKIKNTFLKLWMESNSFQESLKAYSQGAAIQNVASVKILKEIKISLPSLSEQQRIVDKLKALSDETKKLETIYEQKLADLEELKKSILEKAFKGEL